MSNKHDRSGESAGKAGVESNGPSSQIKEDSIERSPKAAKNVQETSAGASSTGQLLSTSTPPPTEADVKDYLLFAVPKKGRLYEQCCDLLKGAGVLYNRSPRLDIALCNSGLPIKLVFLNAKDIAEFVAEGNVDIGITGQDVIQECGVSVSCNCYALIRMHIYACVNAWYGE